MLKPPQMTVGNRTNLYKHLTQLAIKTVDEDNCQPSFVTMHTLSIWACIYLSIYLFCSVADLDMILSVLVYLTIYFMSRSFINHWIIVEKNTIHLCQSKWHLKGKNPLNHWLLGSFEQGRKNLYYFMNTVFLCSKLNRRLRVNLCSEIWWLSLMHCFY